MTSKDLLDNIDLEEGKILVDGDWLTEDEIRYAIKMKVSSDDYNVAELAVALKTLIEEMNRSKILKVRVPKEMVEELEKLGLEKDETVEAILRRIIIDHIRGQAGEEEEPEVTEEEIVEEEPEEEEEGIVVEEPEEDHDSIDIGFRKERVEEVVGEVEEDVGVIEEVDAEEGEVEEVETEESEIVPVEEAVDEIDVAEDAPDEEMVAPETGEETQPEEEVETPVEKDKPESRILDEEDYIDIDELLEEKVPDTAPVEDETEEEKVENASEDEKNKVPRKPLLRRKKILKKRAP